MSPELLELYRAAWPREPGQSDADYEASMAEWFDVAVGEIGEEAFPGVTAGERAEAVMEFFDYMASRAGVEDCGGELVERSAAEIGLARMEYGEYLVTPQWRGKRQAAIVAAGYRCQLCNYGDWLTVHHRTYERRGFEAAADLTVLCTECHKMFHAQRPDFGVMGTMVGDVSMERFLDGLVEPAVGKEPSKTVREMRKERSRLRKQLRSVELEVAAARVDAEGSRLALAALKAECRELRALRELLHRDELGDWHAMRSPAYGATKVHAVAPGAQVAICGQHYATGWQLSASGVSCSECIKTLVTVSPFVKRATASGE